MESAPATLQTVLSLHDSLVFDANLDHQAPILPPSRRIQSSHTGTVIVSGLAILTTQCFCVRSANVGFILGWEKHGTNKEFISIQGSHANSSHLWKCFAPKVRQQEEVASFVESRCIPFHDQRSVHSQIGLS